uniref:Uncharacterized protein n=1 Tax=Glossina pallidipes TaxID=7398 RepID=A0A1B0A2V0_GLOPL
MTQQTQLNSLRCLLACLPACLPACLLCDALLVHACLLACLLFVVDNDVVPIATMLLMLPLQLRLCSCITTKNMPRKFLQNLNQYGKEIYTIYRRMHNRPRETFALFAQDADAI